MIAQGLLYGNSCRGTGPRGQEPSGLIDLLNALQNGDSSALSDIGLEIITVEKKRVHWDVAANKVPSYCHEGYSAYFQTPGGGEIHLAYCRSGEGGYVFNFPDSDDRRLNRHESALLSHLGQLSEGQESLVFEAFVASEYMFTSLWAEEIASGHWQLSDHWMRPLYRGEKAIIDEVCGLHQWQGPRPTAVRDFLASPAGRDLLAERAEAGMLYLRRDLTGLI